MTEKLTVCPVCKSPNIVPYVGFRTGWQYECKKCGYIGALTEEIEVDLEKLKES
jgi:transposase-like protein